MSGSLSVGFIKCRVWKAPDVSVCVYGRVCARAHVRGGGFMVLEVGALDVKVQGSKVPG